MMIIVNKVNITSQKVQLDSDNIYNDDAMCSVRGVCGVCAVCAVCVHQLFLKVKNRGTDYITQYFNTDL